MCPLDRILVTRHGYVANGTLDLNQIDIILKTPDSEFQIPNVANFDRTSELECDNRIQIKIIKNRILPLSTIIVIILTRLFYKCQFTK